MPRIRLYPNAIDTDNANWTLTGAATKPQAIDDLWGNHDGNTSYIESNDTTQTIIFGFDNMPSAAVVNFVELHVIGARIEGGVSFAGVFINIRNGGISGTQERFGLVSNSYTHNFTLFGTDTDGSAWTETKVNSCLGMLTCETLSTAPDSARVTSFYLEVDYVATPAKIGTARDVLSRHLLTFRRPVSIVEITAPLRFADVEIGDNIRLSHFAGETPNDEGWGYEPWEGRLFTVLASSIDLDTLKVHLRLLDLRDYLVSFWDTAISEEAPSAFGQGVARLDVGATRTFTRDSNAWIENAAVAAQNAVQVAQIGDNVEKQGAGGLMIEAAGANIQVRSSFVAGTSGWTSAGTGSNGSAIAVDTGDLLFEDTVSGNSIKFTAGSPTIHVADLTFTGTATSSIAGNSIVRGSYDQKADSGAPLYYAIQRGSSSYWRDSDSTWQGALTWNAMTAETTIHRHITNQIDIGSTDYTLTQRFGIPTATGVVGQINHLYHSQLEVNSYATSRILTTTATENRAVESLTISNDHPLRTWPIKQGTLLFQFIPEWSTADLPSGAERVMFWAQYDADNIDRVAYQESTGNMTFLRRRQAVDVFASVAVTFTRGTLVSFAARWTGEEGEHDLSPYTLSIFADGVKGTDATSAGVFESVAAEADVSWGHNASGSDHADGEFRHVKITPQALSDEEIADHP